jgi:hypothetical protein
MACYSGPILVTDDERIVIWKWAKENAIDQGLPIDKVGDAINENFFAGQAKPEWITDILSGRKTPFRHLANEAWRAQYNRRAIVQQARDISRMASLGPVGKMLRTLWTLPRSVAVTGHGFIFPITHGGDLAFRPESWGTFISGILNTYRGAFSKAHTGRVLDYMQRRALFDTALRSGLDVGAKSHPSGLINRYYQGPAARAWDMLTVMRYELWEGQMNKFIKPDMTQEEVLDIGKNLATWANHATGSGKGIAADIGGGVLFGPKLTQSKLNRLTVDPASTIKTFANWGNATAGEKTVAWTRLSGATQNLVTGLGFLVVNQGLLSALGLRKKEDQINWTDPTKSDFLSFKMGGIEGYVPGLHTEIRTLARILGTAFASRAQLRGESRQSEVGKIAWQYGMGKLTPAIQRAMEVGLQQNWQGRPVPWSSDQGTAKEPRLSWGEYAGSIGPIPLEGPIGYVYDHLRKSGASAMDAQTITKGLIIAGLGATGLHVQEEPSADTRQHKIEQYRPFAGR